VVAVKQGINSYERELGSLRLKQKCLGMAGDFGIHSWKLAPIPDSLLPVACVSPLNIRIFLTLKISPRIHGLFLDWRQ
jgi:hypothetical protein